MANEADEWEAMNQRYKEARRARDEAAPRYQAMLERMQVPVPPDEHPADVWTRTMLSPGAMDHVSTYASSVVCDDTVAPEKALDVAVSFAKQALLSERDLAIQLLEKGLSRHRCETAARALRRLVQARDRSKRASGPKSPGAADSSVADPLVRPDGDEQQAPEKTELQQALALALARDSESND